MSRETGLKVDYFARELNLVNMIEYMERLATANEYYNAQQQQREGVRH